MQSANCSTIPDTIPDKLHIQFQSVKVTDQGHSAEPCLKCSITVLCIQQGDTYEYSAWNFLSVELIKMLIASGKSTSVRGASQQPAFIGSWPTISHTCLPCLPSIWVNPCVLCPLMIELMVVLLRVFHMVSIV